MSGIFGIFNLNGKPVSRKILERMKKPMEYWGPDGQGVWREGPIGMGNLLFYNTPESVHEKLPRKSRCGNYVITAGARIDNRDELLRIFNIPSPEHPSTTDSSLILKAYKKWGENCPDHLLGDWAFAIWDAQKRELLIARDHNGNTGLYYYFGPRFFAFSSCVKGILALPEIPIRLNEMRVAQVLVSWREQCSSTVYDNISRLPPAHFMRVNEEGIKTQQYWHLENTPGLNLKSDREYVDTFLEIYTEAVRCRLRSFRRIGVTLSGGLDSGSVAAIAAREMSKKGQRLLAISSVPLFDVNGLVGKHRFGDETPYIKATAEHVGNIDVNYIRAENVTPLKGIQRSLFLHDEPGHAAGNHFWIVALMQEAQRRGVGTLLTGQGGNLTISWAGRGYLLQLARHMFWKRLWRELRAWSNIHKKPLWQVFAGQIVKPLIPQTVYRCINRFQSGGEEPWQAYSAINPNFANKINLTAEMYKNGHDSTFSPARNTQNDRYKVIIPGRRIGGCLWNENGAGFSMEVRDPTLDKRVMEFCLSAPDDQYLRDGSDRFLIRRAMQDILPENVRLNTLRGRQAADIGERLCKSLDEIKSSLESVKKSELAREFLDIKKMENVLFSLQQKVNSANTKQAGTILLRGLMAGLFLIDYDKRLSSL